jgi:DNA-binding NtrC family response regulator
MSAASFLIADPSSALQTFLRLELEGFGFDPASIKTASTPAAALEVGLSHKPDLLITDWFTKEAMSGPDLYLQVVQVAPMCRLALMAQGVTPEHEQQAKDEDAVFLLPKPFSADMAHKALTQALETLAKDHPAIAQQLHTRAHGGVSARHPPTPQIVLPKLHHYKPGDAVLYRNRTERVQNVILRRGEMVVQLQGIPGMIDAGRIQPL